MLASLAALAVAAALLATPETASVPLLLSGALLALMFAASHLRARQQDDHAAEEHGGRGTAPALRCDEEAAAWPVYRIDLASGAFERLPPAFCRAWGKGHARLLEPGGYDLFEARLHPADLSVLRERLRPAEAGETRRGASSADLRLRDGQGCYRWWRDHATIIFDAQGWPRYLSGTLVEISDLKAAANAAPTAPPGAGGRGGDAGREEEADMLGLNRALETRVAERTAQLGAALKELESFSYSVSHDLRAPLRAIDGYSSILMSEHGERLDSEAWLLLQRIRSGVHRMSDLIDDLLELARVSRYPIRREEVDVSALAEGVVRELRGAEPSRKVEVDIAPGLAGRADPKLLRIALENLLGNAWKFTARNAQARVRVGCREDESGDRWFFVEDDGAGFDMRYVDKLFTPFQRLHHERDFSGTGIGLATVARIVHRHGGRVSAYSGAEGGARFAFTLGPCEPDDGRPPTA